MGVSLPFVIALRNLKFIADFASRPTVGDTQNLYVTQDTGGLYRWTGTTYSAIAINNVSFTVVGSYNATAGTPALTGLTASGQLYIVTTAGTQMINGANVDLRVGDLIVRTATADTYVVIPFQAALAGAVDDGRIPLVSGSTIVNSSLRETTEAIISDKNLEVPQGSLFIGDAVELSEYGGIVSTTSNVTDNKYLPVLYQETAGTIEPISQNKPFYFEFDPAQDVVIQSTDTTTISNVTQFDITSLNYIHRLHTLTLDFNSAVTNFRARITNMENSNIIKYFPSRAAWDSGTGGVDFSSGKQEVYPAGQSEATPIVLPASTVFRIEIQADAAIDLQGDASNNPYVAVNVCQANITFIADASATTASAIRDQLQTLTNDDRLDVSAIKGSITDSNAIHTNVSGEINGLTAKSVPANADIVVIEDSADSFNKKKISLGTIIGGMVTPITPSVHGFSIDVPARVDVNGGQPGYIDRINGSRTVTYSVTNHSHISSIDLQLGGTDLATLTAPVRDGEHSETVTVSGVDLTSATNLVFRIQINNLINSNTQTVEVANLVQVETAYYGVSATNNPASIDVSGLTVQEVESGTSFMATFVLPTNNYAIILIPNNLNISSIIEQTFNQESLSDFTKTDDVRTISSITYDSYVLQNQSQVTGDLIVNITIG